MNKKLISCMCVSTLFCTLMCSCGTVGVTDAQSSNDGNVVNGTTENGAYIEGEPLSAEAGAVDASQIEFKNKDIYSDYSGDAVKITLSDGAQTSGAGYSLSDGVLNITADGTYALSGKLSDGQIVVDAPKEADVRLVLEGVEIYCSDSAPILVNTADKVIISLPEGYTNYIEDKTLSYEADGSEITAVIYSHESLSINGDGSLNIKAVSKDAVTSKDTLKITGGNISINAADDGIVGKDRVLIKDGNIKIECAGDAIKTTNDEDPTLGYVYIEGGSFDITSDGDGIDAVTSILVCGGDFNIRTGGASNVTSSGQMSSGGFFGRYDGTLAV